LNNIEYIYTTQDGSPVWGISRLYWRDTYAFGSDNPTTKAYGKKVAFFSGSWFENYASQVILCGLWVSHKNRPAGEGKLFIPFPGKFPSGRTAADVAVEALDYLRHVHLDSFDYEKWEFKAESEQ
jgi:hypothetical protein